MSKIYEATYENGVLKWLHEKPEIPNGAQVEVVVDLPHAEKREEEIQKILNAARGAWGKGKSLKEIDHEIKAVREWNWSREWDKKQ
jgi:predicted DNA-binding antitoxin AbrB/MazE fold protein